MALTCSKKDCAVFSGSGYPEFAGMSTRKLTSGEEIPFRLDIRRVKYYSPSRHSRTTKGESWYENTGRFLFVDLSKSDRVFQQWVNQRPRFVPQTRDIYLELKEENSRSNNFETLFQNLDEREKGWKLGNNSTGVRIELTVPFLTNNNEIQANRNEAMLKIFQLRKLVESRKEMTNEEFSQPKSQLFDGDINWPFWTGLQTLKTLSDSTSRSVIPVTIFRS